MQTNLLQPAASAEANDSPTAYAQAVVCKELLECPFCGGQPTVSPMRYANTGNIYGYRLECDGCEIELKEQPVCWAAGKKNEEMLEAKAALITRWNRRQPNDQAHAGGA